MEVRVDLGRLEIREIVVRPLAGQHPIHAIINIGAENQRHLQIIIVPNRFLFLMNHVQQPVRIDHGRLIALGRGQLDRKLDEVDVVLLGTRPVRTQAPPAVFSRFRRLHGRLAVFIQMDHFQPRGGIPVRSKRHPFAEMRRQPRPRDFARCRLEPDGPPFPGFIALPFRVILGILGRAFLFTHRTIAVPDPIDHGRVIRLELADLVFRMTGKTSGH